MVTRPEMAKTLCEAHCDKSDVITINLMLVKENLKDCPTLTLGLS